MKRTMVILTAFALLTLLTISAQASDRGEEIFKQKCAMCHLIKGKKGGAIGPELTKISSRMKESEIKSQIENPKKRNKSTTMPSFKALPPSDMKSLLDYLKTLK